VDLAAPPPPVAAGAHEDVLTRRLKAGLLVELGLAEPASARRCQEAVMQNRFDPDACAGDVLAATPVPSTDGRLLERSSRLLRDLVMSPLQLGARGPSKKTRSLVKSGVAAAIVQFLVFGICCAFVFVALFILRWRWDWSVDAFLDRVGGLLTGS
jgi:hypothetical protein